MIDSKVLRQDVDVVRQTIKNRGMTFDFEQWEEIENQRKSLQVETQELQNKRNALSKSIGQKKAKGEDVSQVMADVNQLKAQREEKEATLKQILDRQTALQLTLPNLLHESVPLGQKEEDNVEVRQWGSIPTFSFTPLDHVDLTHESHQVDFQVASLMSGSRFVVMRKDIARMHRALAQFMLDVHIKEYGYEEIYVPFLVEEDALYGSGQLPKFADDLFHTNGERKLSLIPTAEVPLTNLMRDSIIDRARLPLKFVCHSPCFRSEAGSYGKDTKGMIRQHQFEKVELVQVVEPSQSYAALESLTQHAQSILEKLNLAYRVVSLCSGDVGFCAAKTYDIEVWMPSQNKYREISSCSNTEDFQARRLQARFRPEKNQKPEYVHLLNGSGLAVGRTLIAVIENYQTVDGNIIIPDCLQPYMDGQQEIIFAK